MLLRFIEVVDNVTGCTEEQIEEFNKIEIKLKKEGEQYFMALEGEDEFKGVKIVIDFTDEETNAVIQKTMFPDKNQDITKKDDEIDKSL